MRFEGRPEGFLMGCGAPATVKTDKSGNAKLEDGKQVSTCSRGLILITPDNGVDRQVFISAFKVPAFFEIGREYTIRGNSWITPFTMNGRQSMSVLADEIVPVVGDQS